MARKNRKPPPDIREYLGGQMLIAMPNMGDPRFDRSVIFLCAHDEDHAMGVIVNKPLDDVDLSELLEQLEIAPQADADETPVFFGGPVQTERGLVLHTLDYQLETTLELGDGLGLTASRDEPDEEIIFNGASEGLWKRALSKLGVTSAMLSPEWASARGDDKPLN